MDRSLFDTSWSLQYTSSNAQAYRNLFTSTLSQATLQKYSDRLVQYLASHTPQYTDDLDDENDKLGTLKQCQWLNLPVSTDTSTAAISIQLIYQKQTFKFILYGPSLILSKAPPSHTTRLLDFLTTMFSITIDPLKLPSTLLSGILATYISTISAALIQSTNDRNEDELNKLKLTALLHTTLANLKLTISFSGPVAPQLRTIDLDIPHDTVATLLSLPFSSSSHQANSNETSRPTPTNTPGTTFIANLSHYITEQSGLKLPLLAPNTTESNSPTSPDPPLRLARISCAAFALSVDGKVKLSAKAVDNAGEHEDLVRKANGELLEMVRAEAEKRGLSSDA